jgi:hypothetical protein
MPREKQKGSTQPMSTINTTKLFTLKLDTTPQLFGDVPSGFERTVHVITGGSFIGDRLNGRALPGGGDWSSKRRDGVVHVDAKATLETSDGQLILMTYTGRLKISLEARARLASGSDLRVEEIYSRMLVQFETSAPDLAWLNDIVGIGVGERLVTGPLYHIYELN